MNRVAKACLCSMAFLTASAAALQAARSQDNSDAREVIPVIQMDDVPLTTAICSLARQAGKNYIFDPRLCGPWVGPVGKLGREPNVTVRWENLSAEAALGRLLKEHGLVMVDSPATSTTRIGFTNQAILPIPPGAVGGSTNSVIPLIAIEDVPLDEAIRYLAGKAQLSLVWDASVPMPSRVSAVSVRWANVTARQAIVALLDNYNWVLVEDSATGSARIVAKAPAQPGKSAQGK